MRASSGCRRSADEEAAPTTTEESGSFWSWGGSLLKTVVQKASTVVEDVAKKIPDAATILDTYKHDLAEFVSTVKTDVNENVVVPLAHELDAHVLNAPVVTPERPAAPVSRLSASSALPLLPEQVYVRCRLWWHPWCKHKRTNERAMVSLTRLPWAFDLIVRRAGSRLESRIRALQCDPTTFRRPLTETGHQDWRVAFRIGTAPDVWPTTVPVDRFVCAGCG